MIEDRNIVCLVGGVGGAKLAYGLAKIVPPEKLTIIVNTGDDFWHYGLRICPDLDTITYTLAGVVDPENGWGLADESTTTLNALQQLGAEPWFRLGDKDLATHLFRTQLWQEGHTLTHITQQLKTALGVGCTILPMTNDPIATIIHSEEFGELNFQVYFVKHRWQPQVKALRLDGIEKATISVEVDYAIKQADCIFIAPSNPWLSINPILSVPGMRQLIAAQNVPRVAITPIIGGKAIKGPTTKIMQELGLDVSVETIIDMYGEILNGFIYDQRDLTPNVKHLRVTEFDTLMDKRDKRVTLAKNLLVWTRDWK